MVVNRGFRCADGKYPTNGTASIFEFACFQTGPGVGVEFLAIAAVTMFGRELEGTLRLEIMIRIVAGHLCVIMISSRAMAFVESLDAFMKARCFGGAALGLMQIAEGHEGFVLLSSGK